ncbi:MAG: class I tRNA ligase family protein, partial [Oscillospiraceae bacterium]|nr:class I tRNA ligase family protein [Oscillospiraceae bacterium]
AGLERYEAREAIVDDLKRAGLLVKIEPHKHNVGCCQRCGAVVEPIVSLQWFVAMKALAEPAMQVVRDGRLRWVSKKFENTYMQWMENIRDWCVSRQLWWGHRIPAYYCLNPGCGFETAAETAPSSCPKCGGAVRQDEDTLDTWFSSALWPFSTLGFPEDTEDLRYFYPTSVIVPAYDIIPFWVARMIFMGLKFTGDVPFRDVFIHGLIRDEQGRKMSKSLGNGVDPLEIIDKYGADALRMTMVHGVAQDSDIRFGEAKVTAARNFANKLWNAARYVLMNLPEDFSAAALPESSALSIEDKWVLSKYNRLVGEVTANLDAYDLGVAAGKVHDFIWNVYCDWYIELTKPRTHCVFGAASPPVPATAHYVLVFVMEGMLKLLHPFMPFITEEIWCSMPHFAGETESVMVSEWARYSEKLDFSEEERQFEKVAEVISAIRVRRSEMKVPPSKRVSAEIEVADKGDIALFKSCAAFFEGLAGCVNTQVSESVPASDGKIALVTAHARVMLPMGELVDREKELARLEKELERVKRDIEFISGKLSNEGFVAKAPPRQVENERAKLAEAKEKSAGIEKAIAELTD